MEFAKLALDGQRARTFLNASHNLSIDVEAAADVDNGLCMFGGKIYLQAVAHVEHLVHFSPVGAAFLRNGLVTPG